MSGSARDGEGLACLFQGGLALVIFVAYSHCHKTVPSGSVPALRHVPSAEATLMGHFSRKTIRSAVIVESINGLQGGPIDFLHKIGR